MDSQEVIIKIINNKAIVLLNKPKYLNAITNQTLIDLQSAIDQLNEDDTIQTVIIGAEGEKAFSVGGDIRLELKMSPLEAQQLSEQGHKLMESIENSRKPYIAAIHGYTVGGGCEIAIACDFIIAADNTLISVPAINIGMICGLGGNVRLPKLIGKTKAKELLMTGKSIDAEEAFRVGLISKVVPKEELIDAALAFADELTNKSSAALALAKKAINFSMDATMKDAISNEISLFTEASLLEDRKEGMTAFLEKRRPKFKGK